MNMVRFMDELNELIYNIIKISNSQLDKDEKHKVLSNLWGQYHILSEKLNTSQDEVNDLIFTLRNKSFSVNQDTIKKDMTNDTFKSFCTLRNALNNDKGIKEDDAINILNWTIVNTLDNLNSFLCQLGINAYRDCLDGYCEPAQAISIMPLENLGLKVTKNKAQDCFGYCYNHAFGTVTFPIDIDGKIVEKTYLVDPTYRQFFSTVYCNEGMYYSQHKVAPDVGYFADKDFAKELLANGFIELTEESSKLYGLPFYKASLSLDSINKPCDIDFLTSILTKTSSYSARSYQLDGFNLNPPTENINIYR